MPTESEILDALRSVVDPELHRNLVDLGTVRVKVDGSRVDVEVGLVTDEYPEDSERELHNAIVDALSAVPGVNEVNLAFADMGEDDAAALMARLHPGNVPFADENARTRVI